MRTFFDLLSNSGPGVPNESTTQGTSPHRTQFGTRQGWSRAGGVETRVEAARTFATRDRSWGVRPVGAAAPGRPGEPPQVAWLWAPIHFEDEALVRARIGEKRGVGLLEQILLGPHSRYGFQGLTDGARS